MRRTEPYIIWLERVRALAGVSDADLDLVIGGRIQRDRCKTWYHDDMSAEMAAHSIKEMTRIYKLHDRAERETVVMRATLRNARR